MNAHLPQSAGDKVDNLATDVGWECSVIIFLFF